MEARNIDMKSTFSLVNNIPAAIPVNFVIIIPDGKSWKTLHIGTKIIAITVRTSIPKIIPTIIAKNIFHPSLIIRETTHKVLAPIKTATI